MSDFKRHSSGSTFEAEYGYARAVADQDYIHVSGTTGYNYADMTIDPDPATQAEQCLTNIQEALAVFNAALSDVVRVHYLVRDPDDFELCASVLKRRFGAHPPAATMMVVGLIDPAMKIEIEVTARRPAHA